MSKKISNEERSLISAGFKNYAGNKRAELRVINAIERKEHEKGNTNNEEYACKYRLEIEKELRILCEEIINIIESELLPRSNDIEDKVFYFKMKGDYYRYLCEILVGSEFNEYCSKGKESYLEADKLSSIEL